MLTVIIILFLIARLPSTTLLLLNQVRTITQSAPPRKDIFQLSYCVESLKPYLGWASDHYLIAFANIIFMTLHPLTFAVYLLMSR